jgi:dethiobiotin synthetase
MTSAATSGPVRPRRVVVVAGTGTDVGKTWVTCRVAELARARGLSVAVRKPAQSFDPGTGPTEAEILASASGEGPHDVCPPRHWYPVAMAPPMAAAAAGMPELFADDLVAGITWPTPRPELGIIEQAGGIGAPQALDADGVDMVERLAPGCVVLVVRPGLGTLSDTRLAVGALRARCAVGRGPGLREPVLSVFFNRFDPSQPVHRANLEWLRGKEGLDVFTSPAPLLEKLVAGA